MSALLLMSFYSVWIPPWHSEPLFWVCSSHPDMGSSTEDECNTTVWQQHERKK